MLAMTFAAKCSSARARLVSVALLSLASSGAAALGLAACESATNLDVTYGDASAALEASTSADGQGDAPMPMPTSAVVSGCPCDESAGLGCCIPAGGTPFCTADTTVCTQQRGVHVKCGHPDPQSESACCWHVADDGGAGSVAALAATCAAGLTACLVASDCAGSGQTTCATVLCHGLTIGACGATAPACPP
jgi:hypothetical protein